MIHNNDMVIIKKVNKNKQNFNVEHIEVGLTGLSFLKNVC